MGRNRSPSHGARRRHGLHRITGLTRSTIYKGIREIEGGATAPAGRVRRPGGGRKKRADADPDFPRKLEALVAPLARGDPRSPLRWTCKSSRRLAGELKSRGCPVSHALVAQTLRALGRSLQANRKTEEGGGHPDRNAQFEFINARVSAEISSGTPVISGDTKKKELVGNHKNNGRQWHPKGGAPNVNGHDFPGPGVPRAHPYGVYDLKAGEGFVNIGKDHDTAQFAVASIRAWWRASGRKAYPRARRIQRVPSSSVETGAASAGRRDGPVHPREPLSARDEQVEQG